MERDIRDTPLYKEVLSFFTSALEPGFGAVSVAADLAPSPDGRVIAFAGTVVEKLEGQPLSRICTIDLQTGKVEPVTSGSHRDRRPCWSPDGTALAFVSDRVKKGVFAPYVLRTDRLGEAVALPSVEGTVESLSWSPDGRTLAAVVAGLGADRPAVQGSGSTEVSSQDLPDWLPVVESGVSDGDWRRVFCYDSNAGDVRTTSPDGLNVWEAAWAGDGCLLAVVSDAPTEDAWYSASLSLIDIQTRQERRIYQSESQLGLPAASPDGQWLSVVEAACSDRNVVAGDLLVAGGSGESFVRVDTLGIDVTSQTWRDGDRLLFAGIRDMDSVVAEYDASTGQVQELWTTGGSCGGFYPDAAPLGAHAFATVASAYDRYPEITVVEDGQARTVSSFEHDGGRYLQSVAGTIRKISWQAPDGLEIHGLVIVPSGDGPFPLVVNVHGGPVSASRSRWSGSSLTGLLVSRGYAVFYPNPRGSAGRGQDFVRLEFGDVGGAETLDTLAGVDMLVREGIADPARLGVTGGSHGGYMTCWLVTQTDRFAAAVSISPVTDWLSQHYTSNIGLFDRTFLQDDPVNTDGPHYGRSPVLYAARVKTPTLLTAGATDRCTPAGQAREFYQALQENGVESALAVYPKEGHGVSSFPAIIDFATRALDWFDLHMKVSTK